jgi:uncharacterized membrane protein YfcA
MLNGRTLLLGLVAVMALFHAVFWFKHLPQGWKRPRLFDTALGFITNFFDTLGIGSYAPTTTVLAWKNPSQVALIPGTLNIGHALPIALQALIFVSSVEVSQTTLWSMTLASMLGAYSGACVVTRLPAKPVSLGMACALLLAATVQLLGLLEVLPSGGDALGLHGMPLMVAVLGAFVVGGTSTVGVGSYAPTMIMISLLGMNPLAAFPIMMGSAAVMLPMSSTQFIRKQSYQVREALGLTLGGLPGVAVAAFVVKSLPLHVLRWVVVCVVFYAAYAIVKNACRTTRHST